MRPARIYPWIKMHPSRAPSIAPGTFFVAQSWADSITGMPGFNLRQTHHVIVLGEIHLRRILKSYADYYHGARTHRSLHKDAPISRPVQRTGVLSSHAIFGGLHHSYARI